MPIARSILLTGCDKQNMVETRQQHPCRAMRFILGPIGRGCGLIVRSEQQLACPLPQIWADTHTQRARIPPIQVSRHEWLGQCGIFACHRLQSGQLRTWSSSWTRPASHSSPSTCILAVYLPRDSHLQLDIRTFETLCLNMAMNLKNIRAEQGATQIIQVRPEGLSRCYIQRF